MSNGCPVLLVDDNPGDVYLMIEAARERGVELEGCCCATATEVIERLDKGVKPRLILCDLNLPCVSGFDLLKMIKSQTEWRHIVFVAYGGHLSPQDVDQAYAMHANCVVNKPQSFAELQKLIHYLAVFWLEWVIPKESPLPK